MAAVCVEGLFPKGKLLIAHQRRHTGEKPYECHKRRRTFFFKSDLTKHQRIHRERNCVSAVTAKRPSEARQSSFNTADSHQRDHTAAVNVAKP